MLKIARIFLTTRADYSTAQRMVASISRTPVITCKRTQFNLFVEDVASSGNSGNEHVKFGKLELASSGWHHHKSSGDYFIIHPIRQAFEAHALSQNSFQQLGIRDELVQNLKQRHVLFPTVYQAEAIPTVLNGSHILLAAETGCGKTYTYLVPIVEQILSRKLTNVAREFNSPLVLIVTPGRELAQQIGRVVEGFTQGLGITSRVLLGGKTKQQMLNPHFEDVDILIASFGAVSKLVSSGIYRMNAVRWVVLDEADTLLDDSFNAKLLHLMKRFPFHKNHLQDLGDNIFGTQLVLAAATMPSNMSELLSQIVNIETMEEVVSPNLHKLMSHISQRFMRINKSDRPSVLLDIVRKDVKRNRPLIIFSNKTPASDFVSIHLNEADIPCVNLNGDMLLKLRLGQFEKFQSGEVNVLSTTDVASRGLDTTRAAHVINFDCPLYAADYIHRIGRIGRVGSRNDCLVTNLVSSRSEISAIQRIEHAARTNSLLANVDANIKGIIRRKIERSINSAK
ncbi:probable ATP-dependent RNA helicase DDX28 [Toxorhynchites rutilus septentrionalis]|uniref:probable ATP-dependent RNA helicase DDX28 n=1 Tax=Toxorhynchites rutilus septentrionalis TaxID=329112 RepID=UPI002478EB44|nr:probable ATP-dependent RNA helicase DDX28 [Toxorhynchites rutilus septentrionalis]